MALSGLWSCALIIAGCVTVIDGNACLSNDLLFELTIRPSIQKIVIYHNLTLTCAPNTLGDDPETDYQWHRVIGQIPAKAVAVKNKLTIPNVVPEDQGQYYCMGLRFKVHCAKSNNVTVKTDDLLAINMISSDTVIHKGGTVQFIVIASGVGTLSYQWKKRGVEKLPDKVIGQNTTILVIPSLEKSDEGQYYCEVTNIWEKNLESGNVNLEIYGPPTVTTHPSSKLVTSNMSITLDCDGTGTPPISFYWESSAINGKQWTNISNSNGKKLVVKKLDDSEQYRCVVSNKAGGTRSKIAVITVLKIITHPQNKILVVNSIINFSCQASVSSNVTFSWTHNGVPVSQSLLTIAGDTSILTITDVTHNDNGSYVCTVSSGSISVMSNTATLASIGPPVISDDPTGGNVPFGESIMLTCSGNGQGTVVFSWERSSGDAWITVSTNSSTSYTINTSLAIGQYVYRCRVSNEVGSVVSNNATVNVYGPPTITTHPASQLTNVSIIVTLDCEGASRGSITYQWETSNINGGQWMTINNIQNKTLVVGTLEQSQQYRCVVSNEAGSTRSNVATVRVLMITTQPVNIVTLALEDSLLNCSASVDGVTYLWHRIGGNVPLRAIGQNNDTLIIPKATPHDIGEYYCTVMMGNVSAESNKATVAVDDQLTISVMPDSLQVVIEGTANFTAMASGIKTDEGIFTYQWMKKGGHSLPDKVLMVNGTVLTIPNVLKSDNGSYYCIVTNEWNRSVESNTAILDVYGVPIIVTHPTDKITNSSESITLNCQGTGGGSITHRWETSDINEEEWWEISDSDGEKLVIRNVENSEKYRCIVSNEAGRTISNTAIVTLMEIITQPTSPLTVTALEDARFICLSNVDDATYSWHRFGSSVPSRSIGQDNNTLTIPRATPFDLGRYYCIAEKEGISVKSNEAVLVVDDNLSISIESKNLVIGKGNTAYFNATASGVSTDKSNFMYQWRKKGSNSFPDKVSGINGPVLTIPSVAESDEGQYYCTVTNEWSRSVESDDATLIVYDVPEIIYQPVGGNVSINKSISLFCMANSLGTLIYSWERSSGSNWTTVSNDNTTSYTTDTTLAIGQYMYRCRVSNDAGSVVSNIATVNVYGPPTITTHPASQLTNVSISVTLDCEGTGRGSITYQWETSNISGGQWMNISNSNSSTLVVGTVEQSQQYRCVVSNEAGSTRSNVATVTVLKIAIQPINLTTVIALKNVTLSCLPSVDDVKYSWRRVDGLIPSNSQGRHNNTFTIHRITPDNEGTYYCVVKKHGIIAISNNAFIAVDDQLAISVGPTELVIGNGTAANFTATATGISTAENNFMYQWKKRDSDNLPSKVSGVNGTVLVVPSVAKTDEGRYYCIVTNEWGRSVRSDDVTLSIFGHPRVTDHPEDAEIPIGESITLMCRGNGIGLLEYSWERGSGSNWTTVSNDNTTSYSTDTTLAIGQYMYRCRVSNDAGSVVSNIATVNVYGAPTINNPLIDQVIEVHEVVTLNCKASGDGTITYQWQQFSNGSWMDIADSNNAEYTTDVLTQSSQFRCVVTNEAGMTTSNVNILVLGIIVHPEDKLSPVNSTVNLTCTASLSSNVIFSWTHNGMLINESSTTGDTSILTITNIRHSDTGSYECTVNSGSVSVMSNTATLTVYGIPMIMDHPTGDDVIVGRSIALMCKASGLGTIVYSWERNSGSNWTTVSNDNTTSYTTDTTLAIGQYMYRCRVSNEAGSVVSNIATVNVYGPPTITTHPASQLTNVSISVTLDCEGTGRGSITYQWETSNISGGQWMNISNSNSSRLVVGTLEQSQQYRCVVSNEAGSTLSNIATITVLRVTTHPSSYINVLALENVTLNCSASINDVRYSWHRVDGHLPSHAHGRHNSTLVIRRASPHDGGLYYCTIRKEGIVVRSDNALVRVNDLLSVTITENLVIAENKTAQLTAMANGISTGVNNFKYQWRKRDSDGIPDKVSGVNASVLTIPNVDKSDEGQYFCIVTNEWGNSVESNNATLTVFGLPIITTHPNGEVINATESVTLNCMASGRGPLTYRWQNCPIDRNEWKYTFVNSTSIPVRNLIHSEKYRCIVSNEAGRTISNTAIVTLMEIKAHPTNPLTITALEDAMLTCLASVDDATYSWHRVDGSVPLSSTGQDNNTLTIPRVTPYDAGLYYCIAERKGTTVESDKAEIRVNDRLAVSITPNNLLTGEGTTAEFTAVASGVITNGTSFMYQWIKRGSNSLPNKVLAVNETILTIPNAVESDEGQYYCIVTNEWGNSVESDNVTLTTYDVPAILVHPVDHDLPINDQIILTCQASGLGTLVYSWERSSGSNWTTVSSDNTTSYTTDTTLAIGQYMYRCRVSNEAGSVVSNIATVNVYGPPTINNPLIDQIIEVNEKVTLDCKANGDGTITYLWQQFSNGSWMDIADSNNAEYTTDMLTQSSQFRCVVTNEAGMALSNVTILVLGITTHPESKLVPVNSTVNFMCTASLSSNVTFSWTHDGILINESSTVGDTSILTITNVRHSDAGSYVCTVSSGSVSVMSNTATLTFYGTPTITDHPTGDNVIVGRSITLMCKANSFGTIVYSWERSSGSNWTTVSNESTTSYTTDTTLAIGQYMYRCRVSNDAGSVVSNIATVNVYGPPTIITHPASQLTNVSISVTLDCEGTGRGSITYQWETSNISGGQWMNINNSNSSTLVVGTLEQSQQYRCVVSNEAGSTRSNNAIITVLRITTQPRDIDIFALENITLSCSASINDVGYSWHRVDGHLPAHAHGQHNNTLVIRKATPHDGGSYYCTAKKEEFVVRSHDALVRVYDQLSISITENLEIAENETAQLIAKADGISTGVNNFKYQWGKRDSNSFPDKVSGVNTSVLTVPNVVESDEGQYYCIVTNEWGNSVESNNATLTVFGPPIIITHPNDEVINASQSVVLKCEGKGKGTLSYGWQTRPINESNWESFIFDSTDYLVRQLKTSENYRCTVSNEAGRTISNTAIVTLMEIKTHPTNPLTITALEDAMLTCLASVDDATYSWHRVDGSVPLRSIGQDNNTLIIPRVTPYDAGLYYCIAKRKDTSAESSKAEVRVNDHLAVSITPNNLLTGKGTTAEFTAVASGVTTNETNFIYQWIKRDSNGFPDKVSGINGAVLIIPEAAKSDEGQYYCIVTNEWGRSVESDNVTLATYDIPEIIVHPVGSDIPVNGKHNLTCQGSGLGTLIYSWERSSGSNWTIVSNDNTTSYTTDTTLAIGQYMYRCRVSNEAGSVVSNIATVNVYGPPTITTHPASQLTNVSVIVTLDCEGTSRGSITYQWETSNISGGQWMNIRNSNSSRLVVGTLEQSQQYRCVVSNEAGSNRSSVATVTVLKILIQPINLTTVIALESITLSCLASVDDVKYSWRRVDGHVPHHSQGRHNNTFTIHRITPYDEGKYYCVAKNYGITVRSESAIIEVDDQLTVDVNPNVSLIGIGKDANFTAIATGIATNDSNFIYQWMKRDSDSLPDKVIGANDKEFIIPNVSGSDEGRYYCIVINEWNTTARSTDVTLSIFGFARIFDHPENTEIPIRESATLMCRASGEGLLVYSWERNIDGYWTTVSNDNTTSYTTDTTLAIGQYMYRCRVNNDAGSVVSNIATVNVYGAPTINNPLIDQVIEVNEVVTLNCKASGDGTITYQWQQFSNGSWMDIADSNNPEYTTDMLTQSSQFRCVVTNEAGMALSDVTIFVLKIITQPQDKLVSVNSLVNLTCTSSLSSNVTFLWTHNGMSIINQSLSTTGDTSILTITNVRHSDTGSYECTVSSGSVSVTSSTATLTVYGIPTITDHPTGDSVMVGRSTTLMCEANGLGTLMYAWERSSGSSWTTVSNDNTTSYTTDTTLAIGQYMYRCRVNNEAGSVVSNIATVNVYGPPTITTHPASQLTNVSISVTLDCEGTGRGSITYQWETSNISGGQWMNISNSNSSTFVVETLEQSQQYRCVVSNEAGSTRSNVATVTVLKIINQPINSVTVIALQSVTLNCSASVYDVMYSWHRVDGHIPSNSHGQYNDTLTIQRVTPYDEGMYYCTAKLNGISVKSDIAPIVVDDMLTAKILHDKVDIGKGRSANLTVMATGVSTKENHFKYQWRRNDTGFPDKVSSINESMLIIPDVSESDAGQYYCTVTNEWDRSVNSEFVTLTVYGPPVITHNPITDIVITNGKIVDLHCMGAGRGPLTYHWESSSIDGDQWIAIADSNVTRFYVRDLLQSRRYRCVVSNEAGSTPSNVSTITLLDVPDILKHPDGGYVPIGAKFSLTCEATGPGTLMYFWERYTDGNWTTVSNDNTTSYTTDTTLAIGQYMYRCRVSNDAGSVVSNIAIVNVYGPPTITTHPASQLTNVSISVTLDCEGTGRGSITYQWETSIINEEQWRNITDSNSSTLVVGTLKESQQYRCVVSNEAGSNTSNVASITILKITTQPVIHITGIALENVILTCSASVDDVKYSWYQVGDRLSTRSAEQSSDTLVIEEATPHDEGLYYCVASKEEVTVKSDYSLVDIDDMLTISVVPSGIVMPIEGETLHLTAIASGINKTNVFEYQWRKRGSDNLPDKIISVNEDMLVIPNLSISDEGDYYCNVTNEWGRSVISNATIIYIKDLPSLPEEFGVDRINIDSLQLTWRKADEINHYIVHYYLTDQSEKMVNLTDFNGTYTLINLKAYTEYNIYVTAVSLSNHSGTPMEGIKSKTLTVRTLAGEPVIDELSPNLPVSVINKGNYTTVTFEALLPNISQVNGPFKHLYIVGINADAITSNTKRAVNDVGDIPTQKLIEESLKNDSDYYIAAVVNADQYKDRSFNRMGYILGAEDSTTDIYGHTFHNRRLTANMKYFCRIFSISSTEEYEISSNTNPADVDTLLREGISHDGGNEFNLKLWMIVAPAALVALIIIILICIICLICCCKGRNSKTDSELELSDVPCITPSAYSTPSSNGRSLKDELMDVEESVDFADQTDKAVFQNTAYLESTVVKTSIDQPTTLVVGMSDDIKAEISWKKDGEPINHPILNDGSLYIPNTHLNDSGVYTLNIKKKDGVISESLQLTVNDPRLPPERTGHKPVKVEDFTEHVASLKANNGAKMIPEFESLIINAPFTQHTARLLCNKLKNRYKNIAPYDHSRVVLSLQDLTTGSDYINASHVDGYEEARAYIAAQAPTANTVDDFWRMIWEQNVSTIVMLTRMIEDNKVKCHRYWPNSGSNMYGNYKVTLQKEEILTNYCLRQFVIEQVCNSKNHVRVVQHLHFTAWPDHGVPKYATAVLEFQKKVDKKHKRKCNKPMLVHCSAGVGRSGAFIAIDTEIERMKHTAVTDVYNCVRNMRYWRNFMVQTFPQYDFIYLALLEHVTCGVTSITAPIENVEETVNELSSVNPRTYRTGFQLQFECLERDSSKEQDFRYSEATLLKNNHKNRNQKPLPPDASRVIIPQVDGDYINFSYIDGYDQGRAFLVGPGPMQSTASHFWTMIWEQKSYAIVMLGQLNEDEEEVCFKYWPSKKQRCKCGKFTIETTSEEKWGQDIVKRTFKLRNNEQNDSRSITQLQYVGWSSKICPNSSSPLLNLIDVLESIQRKTNNGPITIHCSDGIGRSGTFCALMISIYEFKAEQKVDIFQIIKSMRSQRPGMVASANQYRFIHKSLLTMLKQYSPYFDYNNGTSL